MQPLETNTQLRGTPLVGRAARTSKQRPFSARRGKRSHASKANKTVAESGGFFGTISKVVESGTQILKLPGGGNGREESGTMRVRRGGKPAGPDPNVIFVAGATGRLGARVVRELLNKGYRVRAGVRSMEKAEDFVRTAANYGLLSAEELSLLEVIPCNLEQPETLPAAIGNAGKVVCAVGASESEITDFTAAKRIDGEGTINLVEAATKAGVLHFVLVTSLGTGKIGFPAAILNVFGGVLIFKRKAEEALERSGMPYTIVRPGGMERPRDDYKLTHNIRLETRDKLFGGQVSRLQVAELVTACIANEEASQNKVLEVVAETAAPLLYFDDLLSSIPAEESQEERAARRQRELELLQELEAARQQLSAAEQRLAALKASVAEAGLEAQELKQKEAAVKKEQGEVVKKSQAVEAQLTKLQKEAEQQAREAAASKAVLAAAQQAQRQQRLLSAEEIREIRSAVLNPPKPQEEAPPAPAGPFSLFGGKKAAPKQEAPQEEEEAPKEAEKPAPTKGGLFGFLAPKQKEVVVVEPPVSGKKGGLFAGLLGSRPSFGEGDLEARAAAVEAAATQKEKAQQGVAEAKAQAAERAAQAKAEAAAAAKAKAEAEAAAKAEAEAAAKAEAEAAAKAKAEAEAAAKAKAEAEAAEAKAKAEKEAAARAEAEAAAKAKAEAEAKAKAEAAAAAKQAAEEAAKKEAEAKAKAEADKKAAAEYEADAAKRSSEAKAWIDAWRKRTAAGAAAPEAPAAAAAAEEAPAAADSNPLAGLLRLFGAAPAPAPAKEAATPAVPAAAAAPAVEEKGAEERQKEAKAWIAAWRERTAAAAAGGNGAAPAPAAPKANDSKAAAEYEAEVVKRVTEAQAWVEAWRKRTAAAAAAPAPPAAAAAEAAPAPAVAAEEQAPANPLAGLLRLFGAAPAPAPAKEEAPAAAAAPVVPAAAPAVEEKGEEERQKEAKAWIAAWRERTGAGAAASSSNGASPAAPAAEEVPANVQEAKEWISAWKTRQAK